jgi:inorganic pyrophosphatase
MIGKVVTVIVDRPLGSAHPKYPSLIYPVNYGYVSDMIAPDGRCFTEKEIREMTAFQERYFDIEIEI